MAVSTQSIRSKGSKRGLKKILHTPQTSMGRLSGQVQNPGKFRRTMFAGLLRHLMRPLMVGSVAAAVAAIPVIRSARAANDQNEGSGLPLPRFVSLKSDHVNVRGGPNKDHDVAWVYTRPALPVEITAEYENWRKIRDRDGSEGWVYHTLLSGKRTAYVARPKVQPNKAQPARHPPANASPDLVPL